MPKTLYRVHLRKEALKFSAAHMTVFPDGSKEALHGHNYRTEVTLEIVKPSLSGMLPFATIKDAVRALCLAWDEKVLLQENCPFLEISRRTRSEVDLNLCGKRYVFPADEVVLLPVDNITTEVLAEQFSAGLIAGLRRHKLLRVVRAVDVRVDEISGQGASYYRSL